MLTTSMPASTSSPKNPFPTRRIDEIEPVDPEKLWLIENLWLREGVGLLGAPPKHYKTWLASDISLSVATGTPALGRYAVREPGPVVFFGAEDSSPSLRTRFESLAQSRGIGLDGVPLHLIEVSRVRLDTAEHLRRLEDTLELHRPRLLVLDPLVRVAAIDENSSAEVSAVLGALRRLQRDFQVAVLLVHHLRKASGSSPTQAFRGSGDFGAWSDSNLILRCRKENLVLSLEHRSAPAPDPISLVFRADPAPHFAHVSVPEEAPAPHATSDELELALLECLPKTGVARPTIDLREQVGRRKADVLKALGHLQGKGLVERTRDGWRRTEGPSGTDTMSRFPVPSSMNGNPGTRERPQNSSPKTPVDSSSESASSPGERSS